MALGRWIKPATEFLPIGWGAQSGATELNRNRPFGTAAEFTVVPVHQIASLPENVPMDQGACLGIPGITADRAVHVAGPVTGRTVLVQGAAGAVGLCAVQLARHAGAHVIGTVRSAGDEATRARPVHTKWFGAIRS